jgi:hypothetical protein
VDLANGSVKSKLDLLDLCLFERRILQRLLFLAAAELGMETNTPEVGE